MHRDGSEGGGRRAVCAFLVMCLAGGWTVSGATDVRKFPYLSELKRPEGATRTVAAFRVDGEIFDATEDAYSNLRLFDDKENERPVLLRTAKTTKTEIVETKVEFESVGFQKLPDNKVELVYVRKEKESRPSPAVVVFSTALRNYEKQVTVWGSHDRVSWELVAENQPIFDYSRFIDLRNNRVVIRPVDYAYYRLLVANITEAQQSPLVGIARETKNGVLAGEIEHSSFRREDFRIDRVDFLERKENVVRSRVLTRDYPVKNLTVTNDVKEKTSVITFETGRAPLTGLKILTGSANFSRSVRVECPDPRGSGSVWRQLVVCGFSRIEAGGFKQDNTRIGLGGAVRCRQLRVTIENRDNPPLDISGIEAEGEMVEAVFFPESASAFRVMYGAESMEAAVYDIAEVLARVEGADADAWSVGPRTRNPVYRVSPASPVDGRKILVAAILLMVGGLLWVIVKTVKRIDKP